MFQFVPTVLSNPECLGKTPARRKPEFRLEFRVDKRPHCTYRSVGSMAKHPSHRRQQVLRAALKRFAEKGYAGTSIQEIVDAARVTKPTLYYYFQNKADLYRALVEWAYEQRYRLMQEAAARGRGLARQLTEICFVLFAFIRDHRELTRLAFATGFMAPGEVPAEAACSQRGLHNFEFLRDLMRKAAAQGELSPRFAPEELAMAFVGMMHLHIMAYLIKARPAPDRRTARRLVRLFLAGAGPT
jgi:TetR/AcrR family transcriptional regulator